MRQKKPDCLRGSGSPLGEMAAFGDRSIEPGTMQAFSQLPLQTEDLALELAVRLRVLGKSLAATCPWWGTSGEKRPGDSVAYQTLRYQLDSFLGSQAACGLAGQHYFPVIRAYLQDSLPYELNGCGRCRIDLVEKVVSLLSGNNSDHDELSQLSVPSFPSGL